MTRLAAFSFGRIILHTACLIRDRHWHFHWAGIKRELHLSA